MEQKNEFNYGPKRLKRKGILELAQAGRSPVLMDQKGWPPIGGFLCSRSRTGLGCGIVFFTPQLRYA